MAGFNVAYMQGSELDAMQLEYGYSPASIKSGNGGLRIAYSFMNYIAIESGLIFSGKGFRIQVGSESGTNWSDGMPQSVTVDLYFERRITFLQVPFNLRLQTPALGAKGPRLFACAGMLFGLVTKATDKAVTETHTSDFPNQGESVDRDDLDEIDLFEDRTIADASGHVIHYSYNDFYRRDDFCILAGAGIEQRFVNVSIFFQAQYQHGLKNFNHLSDNARQEIANFSSSEPSSGVVLLGEPEALFRSVQVSTGLHFYIHDPKKAISKKRPAPKKKELDDWEMKDFEEYNE